MSALAYKDDLPARPRLVALQGGAQPATAPRKLEEALSLAWTAVSTGHPAACPVCDGRLEPRWTAGAGAVGGRCRDCGSTLD